MIWSADQFWLDKHLERIKVKKETSSVFLESKALIDTQQKISSTLGRKNGIKQR